MLVFNNNQYNILRKPDYTTIIKERHGSLILEIGMNHPQKKRKPRKQYEINTTGVKRELLEYHYGIYRMFPCSYQHGYHMNYIHIKGVTDRNIIRRRIHE